MNPIYALAVNLGTTHFVSFADFLVRGLFLPALFVFCVWGFMKTAQDLKEIDYEQPYDDEKTETVTEAQTEKHVRPEIKVTTNTNHVA